MLLLIGVITAAVIIGVWAAESREQGTSAMDEYCSMECISVRQHRLSSCC